MNPISLFRSNDPYEQLIQQMLVVEGQPQDRLRQQKSSQDRLKKVVNDVDSKLSALHTLVKSFTDVLSNPFEAKSASLSDSDAYSISAGNDAALGSHSLDVLRLASADTRISKQLTGAGSELRNFFDTNGAQSFSIEVAHPTEADPSNRVSVAVTVDPTGTTDAEILDEVRSAIKTAMDDAVAAGTIKKEEAASASVVNETTSTARLTLKSGQTGFTNRLTFTDSANGFLGLLEVNAGTVASGTGGGQVTAVGTTETDSELNSKFTLDGLTLYRDSNSISDALEDVTVNLKQAGLGPASFSISADKESIKTKVQEFIKKYNDLQSLITAKSEVDGDTGVRGDLAGDSTFRSLRYSMRNDVANDGSGQPAGAPVFLTDLGIEIKEDGTLELTDEDELLAAVEKDADAVESLFAGADGIATRLKNRIDGFVGSSGIISARIKSIDSTIQRLEDRIEDWDDKLQRREESLRMRFAKMQETIAVLQGQQQNMSMFFGGF